MIVNLVYNFNRLYIGIILCFILLISYYFNLDNFLILLIIGASIFDLWKSKFLFSLNFLIIFFIIIILTLVSYLKLNFFLSINIALFFLIFLCFFLKFYVTNFFPIIIIIFIYNLINLSVTDRNILYLCFVISFLNDTSAYIAGNIFKGPLILPSVSPKKTWSGTIVSSFFSIIVFFSLGYDFLISFILGISFFIGDIYFSYIKRLLNLKDFSNLLSSHGGILDRLDSIFLSVIIMNLYLYIT